MSVRTDRRGPVAVLTLNRPEVRNAIDGATAQALLAAFEAAHADPEVAVVVLTGAGEHFCAGADLKALTDGTGTRHDPEGPGPLGPTRLEHPKPVIAAVEGYAVAGGLELALMADLRVASTTAVFGVYCRRWGVPLIDGGTVRLPRIVGQGRALDMILTGRSVGAEEALAFGLANRVVCAGTALDEAVTLAQEIARFPRACLLNDRASALAQWSLPLSTALQHEAALGESSLADPGLPEALQRFKSGKGRGGDFGDI